MFYFHFFSFFNRLSEALEKERQKNMQTAITTMLADVKTQKLNKMKSIKRLSNEKIILNSKFKSDKDENSELKIILDQNMTEYRQYQALYDFSDDTINDIDKDKKKSELEGKMIELLTTIERDRGVFIKGRDTQKVRTITVQ